MGIYDNPESWGKHHEPIAKIAIPIFIILLLIALITSTSPTSPKENTTTKELSNSKTDK